MDSSSFMDSPSQLISIAQSFVCLMYFIQRKFHFTSNFFFKKGKIDTAIRNHLCTPGKPIVAPFPTANAQCRYFVFSCGEDN